MTELPDLQAPLRRIAPSAEMPAAPAVVLTGLDYQKARAVPGAIYSSAHKGMVIYDLSTRGAIVALALFPQLADEYPVLVDMRDAAIQDVSPTDYATPLAIEIDAPDVEASLHADAHDWLEFDEGQDGPLPRQDVDLGYAAAILAKHHAFYLGWARGYGKTLGTAAIIEANGYDRVLVAVPNSAKQDVWQREFEKRNIRHTVIVIGNTAAQRARALDRVADCAAHDEPFVFVVHHEALAIIAGKAKRASGRGWTILDGWKKLGITWDLFAFDEAHRLKSAGRDGSQLHRAACKVPAVNRLALSGSVFENRWDEVYGPLHWLFPHRYHAKWDDWNNRHFDWVDAYGQVCVGVKAGQEQALRDELGVFMLIREKPVKAQEHVVKVDLGPTQRDAYEQLRDDYVAVLDSGEVIAADPGIVLLGRLRQLATGLNLLSELDDSVKIDTAMKVISDYEDFDDFFVACWYKASAYALRDRLVDAGYDSVYVITGDVPVKQRAEIIQKTRDTSPDGAIEKWNQPTILIGTIPTLGESANLQHLNHVIRIDRSFNPALNRQVVDRVDRTGQQRAVRLTDIIARDTVDELVVMPSLANKDAFRALVLGRGA